MIEALRAYFARRGDVHLAVLFGSLARGEARPSSDADIGVRFAAGQGRAGLDHPLFAVAADLPALCGRRVDVVDLDRASPALAYAAAADGVLLFEAQPGLEVSFRAGAYDRSFDTAPLRRLQEACLLEDLLRP